MTAISPAHCPDDIPALDRIPGATRWRDPQPSPLLRLLGIRTDDPRFAGLKQALWQGDPLADAVADWVQSTRGGWALFQQALAQGIGSVDNPPACLAALFARVDARPHWVDDDLMRRGAAAVLRSGLFGSTALGAVSLVIGYAADAAVKPLAMTGNLRGGAYQRLRETSRWTVDCAESGTLARDSHGFHSTLKVRLMHAFIRQKLRARPEWRERDWGVPILQLDMVATQLEFSTLFILGCGAQGLVFDRAEREAVMHYYRYVCWLMGVDDDLQPRNFREGLELAAMLFSTANMAPDSDSTDLTRGFYGALEALLEDGPVSRPVAYIMLQRNAVLSRLFLGNRTADAMQVPKTRWRLPVLASGPLVFAGDRLLGLTRRTRAWRDRLGRRLFAGALLPETRGFIPTMDGRPVVAESVS